MVLGRQHHPKDRRKENWESTARDAVRRILLQKDVGVSNIDVCFEEKETAKVQLMYRYQLLIGSEQGECQVMTSTRDPERAWETMDANYSIDPDPSRLPYRPNPRHP
jgi:hypothetical protein